MNKQQQANWNKAIDEAFAPHLAIEKVVRFVKSHPGFYAGHTDDHVVIAVEWVNARTSESGTDYETASTIQAARNILGY